MTEESIDIKSLDDYGLDIASACNKIADDLLKEYEVAEPQWISVEDRVPEPYEEVLVIVGDIVDFAHVDDDGKWHTRYVSRIPVLWWMPLPEPPETK